MGFLGRFVNGVERVVDAAEGGWKRDGFVRAVVYGAVAAGGEAVVQPISAGMSLFGKGDALDQKYQKMYDATTDEVRENGDDPVNAYLSLASGSVRNTMNLPGAILNTLLDNAPEVDGVDSEGEGQGGEEVDGEDVVVIITTS